MPSGNATNVRAGGAFVEFFAKDGALNASLRNIGQKLKNFGMAASMSGAGISAIGTAVLTPLMAATKMYIGMGDEVAKAANRTGMAAEQISTLGYAASQSGSSVEELGKGVVKMQQHLDEAIKGSDSARKTFENLKLNIKELASLSPDEQFRRLAEAIANVEDPAVRTAAAVDVFGEAGVGLLPLLNSGSAGIAGLEARAKSLGLVIKGTDATNAERLGDAFSDVWSVLKSGVFVVGAALAPALEDLAGRVITVTVGLVKWLDSNREVVIRVAMAAATAVAFGSALSAVGAIIFGAGVVLSGLASVWSVFAGVVVAVFSPLAAVSALFGLLSGAVAILVSPMGLLIAALSAVVYWSGAGGEVLRWLGERFGEMKEFALATFEALRNALGAGDWEAAGSLLWSALKLAWIKGTATLSSLWRVASGEVVETWKGTVEILSNLWSGLIAGIESKLAAAQNKTASWIIEAQRQIGALSDSEAAGAQAELQAMGQEAQQRIADKRSQAQLDAEAQAEKRREAARQADAAALAESAKAVADAQAEYDAALKAANEAKPKALGGVGPNGKPHSTANLDGLGDTLRNSEVKTRASGPAGTFSALASLVIGGGSVAEKTLKASEETARNSKYLKKLDKLAEESRVENPVA